MLSSLYRYCRFSYRQIYRSTLLRWLPVKHFSENGERRSFQFKTFNDMVLFRRLQAEKSVLIGVNSDTHIEEALEICQRFGAPAKKIVFRPGNISEYQLVCLVELGSVEEVQHLLGSCRHVVGNGGTPVFSRLLCHQSNRKKGTSLQLLENQGHVQYVQAPTQDEILQHLSSCKNAKEQMETLHREERLPDLGLRLRFLLCRQVEDSLRGLLPRCWALPFGSSVNGFGNFNSDLDISLDFKHSAASREGLTFQSSCRQMTNERVRTQMTLDTLGDLIQNFFPCVSSVHKILRARVPILKIRHTITDLDCDISMSNYTGLYMSELLYLLGELDPRVRPLVFAVRKWARTIHLTQETSGQWITNFSLTLMVVFFLQTRKPAVLPTLRHLKDLAGPEDVRTADGVDCTFKRNLTAIPESENTEDVGSLLARFFWFCAEMKWKENGLSLVTGEVLKKPDASSLFIQNPLETHLNVCSIVNNREVERFTSAVNDVLWELESNPHGEEQFKFILSRADTPKRSRGIVISQLFGKANTGPARIQRNPPQQVNAKTNEKVEQTSRAFSSDLNAELLKLQDSQRSEKKSRGKLSQRPRKPFSSADLWKIL